MIDPETLQMMLGVLTGWLDRRERETIAYPIEENRSCGASWGPGGCA